ncbi:MAG: serine/threonine-protein kinase, partial [Polyangia bacterium]
MAQAGSERIFDGTTRFQLRRRIGEGGMGVVWEALDKERLTTVALKTLRTLAPDTLLRFKHEFRALQDLSHPNLVSLGELIEEGGQWFFTMELVRGVGLMRWVRPSEGLPYDEARLRTAFAQLADALASLHARGLVHRDLKPSNVLVTASGRVVLLDFGLVAEAAYRAPEQARGEAIGPAADWYAVGAALFEALTGELPDVEGAVAPSPRAIAPEIAADLDALCRQLLDRDPAARPGGSEVLRRLGVAPPAAVARVARFVGRAAERAALHAAFDASRARPTALLLHGESGVGKSALVRRFIEELGERAPEAVVFAGRCYERESVHYKAIDGAIDALTRWLSSLLPDELGALLPREMALAAELFPVLERVDAIAAQRHAPALEQAPEDPQELRNRAFAALRALFGAIGARRPLVVALDDLQWADADSLALIGELVRAPDAPRLLLVATMRANSDAAPAELGRRLGADVRLMALAPLEPNDARALAAELLGRAEGEGPLSASVIAAEAHGHPMFIDELVRHKLAHGASLANPPLQLDDALTARAARLDDDARRVLEIIAVAGAPITQGIAAAAAACDFDVFARIATELRAQNLARTSGIHPSDTIEPYHDRVRESLLRRLDPAVHKMRHGRLAMALEAG